MHVEFCPVSFSNAAILGTRVFYVLKPELNQSINQSTSVVITLRYFV